MKSLVETNSIFGNCPEIFKRRVNRWKNRNKYLDEEFLIIDDKDGHLGMYPLRCGFKTTVYESNYNLLFGGKMDVPINIPETNEYVYVNKNILGFEDRAKEELVYDNLNIINKNFYMLTNLTKYFFVACSKSLNRIENNKISMKDKIIKLRDSVKRDGYIFIEYYLAADEKDYEKYPLNSYLRKDEILEYFDIKEWTILLNDVQIQKDCISPFNKENNNVLIGYFEARYKPSPVAKVKSSKKIRLDHYTNKEIECLHNYSINGVIR